MIPQKQLVLCTGGVKKEKLFTETSSHSGKPYLILIIYIYLIPYHTILFIMHTLSSNKQHNRNNDHPVKNKKAKLSQQNPPRTTLEVEINLETRIREGSQTIFKYMHYLAVKSDQRNVGFDRKIYWKF